MSKKIRILQTLPKDGQRFLIVPIGTYLNPELQEAKAGTRFEVWQNWRHDEYVVVQSTKIRINTPEFTFLMRYVYGQSYRVANLLEKFSQWSYDAGAGYEGFDREYALVVEIKPYKDDL